MTIDLGKRMMRWWIAALMSATAAFVLYLPFLYMKSFEFESLLYIAALVFGTVALAIGILGRRLLMKVWTTWKVIPAVAAFWAVSILMFLWTEDLRPRARWLIESGNYQDMVLRQAPDPISGLRHAEWDGSGWAGMDTSVELVYDPSDSLAKDLNANDRYAEVAAKAAHVQRLSRNWYSVTLFTSETW